MGAQVYLKKHLINMKFTEVAFGKAYCYIVDLT